MKVKFTKEAKKFVTLAEAPYARQIIEELKEEHDIYYYAQLAAGIASGSGAGFEILKATAEIAKNNRADDAYGPGTGTLDVWLEIYAYNQFDGFYEIGVYLTDIWQLDGENGETIKKKMFLNAFTRH